MLCDRQFGGKGVAGVALLRLPSTLQTKKKGVGVETSVLAFRTKNTQGLQERQEVSNA